MEYLKVSNNVYVMYPLQARNLIKNAFNTVPTTCIATPEGLIFVDCGTYPDLSAQFRLDMEKKFERKTSHLLFTHLHWDHFLAMEVFKDVNIVASELGIPEFENFINTIEKSEEDKWNSLFLIDDDELINIVKNVNLFSPNILVKRELRIGSKNNEIVYRIIGGHSIDSAYIYFPSENVLCAGDNLLECFAQLPGTPDETLKIFSHWETLDINMVIPGHGIIIDKEYLLRVKSYFEKLIFTLKDLIKQKIPRRKVFINPKMPPYFARNHPNWTESSKAGMKWIEMTIKSWYRYLKRTPG